MLASKRWETRTDLVDLPASGEASHGACGANELRYHTVASYVTCGLLPSRCLSLVNWQSVRPALRFPAWITPSLCTSMLNNRHSWCYKTDTRRLMVHRNLSMPWGSALAGTRPACPSLSPSLKQQHLGQCIRDMQQTTHSYSLHCH